MVKQFEFNKQKYWVTVDPVVHQKTGEVFFIAYVSEEEPGGLYYGTSVKDPQGRPILFTTEYAAFANANAVKQSELGAR